MYLLQIVRFIEIASAFVTGPADFFCAASSCDSPQKWHTHTQTHTHISFSSIILALFSNYLLPLDGQLGPLCRVDAGMIRRADDDRTNAGNQVHTIPLIYPSSRWCACSRARRVDSGSKLSTKKFLELTGFD